MKNFALILPIALLWSLLHFAPASARDSNPLTAVLKKMDTAAAAFAPPRPNLSGTTTKKSSMKSTTFKPARSTTAAPATRNRDDGRCQEGRKRSQEPETRAEVCTVQPGQGSHVSAQTGPGDRDRSQQGPLRRKLRSPRHWRQRTGSAQGLRRDLCRARRPSAASPRRNCNSSPSPKRCATPTIEFFSGSISTRGSRCSSSSLLRKQDYRLVKYSNIQVNGKKIPEEVFKLKTTSKTQTISPRG
jgi:hypothetical protein